MARQPARRFIEMRLLSDAHFLYNAFAPIGLDGAGLPDKVLVKVGISTVPMNRLVSIHCGCPFPIEFAAFAAAGNMKTAKRIESRILTRFKERKTRGEWILLDNTPEARAEFSQYVRAQIEEVIRRPVAWARVTKEQLAEEVRESVRMRAA